MRQVKDYIYKGDTRSTCPTCKKVINARIHEKHNKLYLQKFCPDHGKSTALISSDSQWTEWARKFNKPGEQPFKVSSEVKNECPNDCGLCPDHEQHSCFAQVEITNTCDLTCKYCYMGPDNKNKWFLSLQQAESMFSKLVEMEGNPEVITLTGGEPTLHPKMFEIAEIAMSKNIQYVLVNTNGNKLAKDQDFVKKMADMGLFCYLQIDGFTSDVYKKLRGVDLLELKEKALENLEKYNCPTVLSPVIAKGINEDQVGKLIQYAIEHKFVKCVSFLPMTFVKQLSDENKGWIAGEPACHGINDRLTLPEVLDIIGKYTDGLLTKNDFVPVPCHHPSCGAVTYLLIGDNNEVVPVSRVFDVEPYLDYIKNRSRVDMNDLFQMTRMELEKLWSMSAISGSNKVIDGIKKLVTRCCGTDCEVPGIFEDNVKQISVHMFMDAHTWDIDRARKCCIHFLLPDGKLMPFCQYNIFHRDKVVSKIYSTISSF